MPFLVILSEVHSPQRRWNQTSVMQSNPRIYFFALTKGRFSRKIPSHLYTLNNQLLIILWLSVPELTGTREYQERKPGGKDMEKRGFNIWGAGSSRPDPFIYSLLNLSPPSGESSKSDACSCSQNLAYVHGCDAASSGLVLSCCPWPAPGSPDGDMRGPFCTPWRLSLSHWQSLHWLLCEPFFKASMNSAWAKTKEEFTNFEAGTSLQLATNGNFTVP